MPRPVCYRCAEPIERDDIDIAQCRTCGELFCGEECRDDHVVAMHPPAYLADKRREEIRRYGFETFASWLDRQVLR
jgi:hypothetical protein